MKIILQALEAGCLRNPLGMSLVVVTLLGNGSTNVGGALAAVTMASYICWASLFACRNIFPELGKNYFHDFQYFPVAKTGHRGKRLSYLKPTRHNLQSTLKILGRLVPKNPDSSEDHQSELGSGQGAL